MSTRLTEEVIEHKKMPEGATQTRTGWKEAIPGGTRHVLQT